MRFTKKNRVQPKWILQSTLLAIVLWADHSYGASITISVIDALSFGKFAAGTGGSVTITPAGARTKLGGVALLSSATGSHAKFHITGDPNAAYVISLPGDNDASLSSGAGSISLTQFTSGSSLAGSLDGTGVTDLTVGATLVIDPNKQAGDYSGSYAVTINYQ